MCLARRAEWIRPFVGPSACVRASTTRTPLVHHGMRPAVLGLVVVASACGGAGAPATRDDGAQPVAAQAASEAVTSGVPPVDPTSAPPANTPAVGETDTGGPPVPPPPGASPATIAPLLRERIGPADARVAPPGTLESHVEFFQRIPVTVNDRGPVGGVANTGLHADRLSINVELPTEGGLRRLAPEKDGARIEGAMRHLRSEMEDKGEARRKYRHAPRFAPAGQSTQMIVGADAADDRAIIARASSLYDRHRLRRVYYSAFSPIPSPSAVLPLKRPPLLREHRLYQSDWMMRFYGYEAGEIAAATDPTTGCLPLDIDPKLAWALNHRATFPVDVNRAPREALLRVPGLGVKAVDRILASRRHRRLRLDDVARLTVSIAKLRPFLVTADWRPTALVDRADLRARLAPPAQQLDLFAA